MTTLNSECARKWWLISAGTGVVVAFIAGAVLGVWWLASVLLGVIVGGVMGYVTVRTQCEQTDIETARPQEPTKPAASPEPAKPEAAAPEPSKPAATAGPAKPAAPSEPTPEETAKPAPPPPGAASDAKPDGATAAQPETGATGAGTPPPPPADESRSAGIPPERLGAPRAGQADDLKRIKGLGPKFEERLNELGIYHFDQIAAWSADEIAWVEAEMNMSGRVAREDWIAQARRLQAGEAE